MKPPIVYRRLRAARAVVAVVPEEEAMPAREEQEEPMRWDARRLHAEVMGVFRAYGRVDDGSRDGLRRWGAR
jgi:hypothetical protein